MQDAIMKGNGNSRYLKSVASFLSLYPTYEDFAQALMAGTLPVDLNGVNSAGWTQQGTPLNKANLLTDATAALYGLGTDAVPDEVLAAIKPLIDVASANADGRARVQLGSYTGTGTYGSDNPNSLTFDFEPKIVLIQTSFNYYGEGGSSADLATYSFISPNPQAQFSGGSSKFKVAVFWEEKTVSWYSEDNYSQKNNNGRAYVYAAIG